MQSNFVKGASRGKRANFEAVSPIRKSASGEGAAAAAAAADATGKRARHAQPLRVLANNEVSVVFFLSREQRRAERGVGGYDLSSYM